MTQTFLTPKFLTQDVAKKAVAVALGAVLNQGAPLRHHLERHHCHIVILVPGMEDAREADYPNWPNYPLKAVCLYEEGVGDSNEWQYPYDNIARCKALQLWTGRNDGRTGIIPHLLYPGDTPYWGGVDREGIVVTCSGPQSWFDKLISGIVADTMIALAHHMYDHDPETKTANFLT